MDLTLVLLCAGASTRFGAPCKKQWLRIGDDPLWLYVARGIGQSYEFDRIVIAGDADEIDYMRTFCDGEFFFVTGGTGVKFR